MNQISNQFQNLKDRFQQAGEQDAKMRAGVRLALADMSTHVSDITLKPNLVVLTATNKSAASELFLRREDIKGKLPSQEVVIR